MNTNNKQMIAAFISYLQIKTGYKKSVMIALENNKYTILLSHKWMN